MSATISVVAEFPEHYFLENLAVRSDNSVLITAMNQKELWYVPPQPDPSPVTPELIHTFEHRVLPIVETEPDVFIVGTSEIYRGDASDLHRIDLRTWHPGDDLDVTHIYSFDKRAKGLDGGCLLGPSTLLFADCMAGLIWRADLGPDGVTADIWLAHDSMSTDPDRPMTPPQPGINGLGYDSTRGHVYYTSTSRQLFMRVEVDPRTLNPSGDPEQIGGGTMADDFCIDEHARVAYVTTHRQNTIDCVQLDGPADQPRVTVAGDPLDETLLGPSSAVWGRLDGELNRIAYVTADGGTTNPLPDGSVRTAKLLRVDFGSSRPSARPHPDEGAAK